MSYLYSSAFCAAAGAILMYVFLDRDVVRGSTPTLKELVSAYEMTVDNVHRLVKPHSITVLVPEKKDQQEVLEFLQKYYKKILEDDFCMELN